MSGYFRIGSDPEKLTDIYYIKGNGISLRSESEGTQILLSGGFYDFDCAYRCESNTIHILGQNGAGSIVHILHGKDGWKRRVLLTGKLKLPYPKYFRLLEEGEQLLAVFSIRHDGECLLVSQVPGEEDLPVVIDYVSDRAPHFWAGALNGTASVVYRARDGAIKEKKRNKGKWMSVVPFPMGDREELFFAFEKDGEEHRLTQEKAGGASTVRHHVRKNGNIRTRTVEENENDIQDTCVFFEHNTLCMVSIGRESGRFYRYMGKEWEQEHANSERLSKERGLRKGILLRDRRIECVGSMQAQGLSVLFPKEEPLPRYAETDITEKMQRLQAKITEMERRISRMEKEMRMEKGAVHSTF